MKRVRQHIKTFAYLSLLLIGLLIINSILFTHTQTLADGTVLVHAHPYNKTDNLPASHHHHKSELLILDQLNVLFFFAAIAFILNGALVVFKKIYLQQLEYVSVLYSRQYGRAPPLQ